MRYNVQMLGQVTKPNTDRSQLYNFDYEYLMCTISPL